MPIYDFKCECGKRLIDALVAKYDSKQKCPACGAIMARELTVNVIGIHGDLPGVNIRKKREKERQKERARAKNL